VVPVYNSEAVVEELVRRISQAMEEVGESYEIILADDCSSDGVWQRILEIARLNPKVKGYRLSNNFGQWMATLAGVSKSIGRSIVTIDDDLEYDPKDIQKLIQKFKSADYYIVFGLASEKYTLQGKNEIVSQVRNKAINTLWQKYLTDSFRIFKREVLFKGDEFYPNVHFEAFINFNISERFVGYCPVSYHARVHGTSNHSFLKKVKLLLKYSLEYYKYPSKGLSLLLAVVLLAAMFLEYLLFRGKLNGLLLAVMNFVEICILLLLLQYAAQTFLSEKRIPPFWIVESTPSL
jgi:polyisoprenyl-phosphate glycosyltransferase